MKTKQELQLQRTKIGNQGKLQRYKIYKTGQNIFKGWKQKKYENYIITR